MNHAVIQAAHRIRPFRPFTIHTHSGDIYRVGHHEQLAVSPDTWVLGVICNSGQVALVDIENITEIRDDSIPGMAPVEG